MITAAASNFPEVVEELLSSFVDISNKECFAAMFSSLLESNLMMVGLQHTKGVNSSLVFAVGCKSSTRL